MKSECLDRMILFGEGSLRRALREYVVHFQEERPHQGLGNELVAPPAGGAVPAVAKIFKISEMEEAPLPARPALAIHQALKAAARQLPRCGSKTARADDAHAVV